MYICDEIDRELLRLRKEKDKSRPLIDYFSERDILDIEKFKILIEPVIEKAEKVKKRKLVL